MAVLTLQPGLKVEIHVNGQALNEWIDDEEDCPPNTVIKYVEATSGAKFEVHFTYCREFLAKHEVVTRVYLDNKYADGSVHTPRSDAHHIGGAREFINGKHYMRDFRFSRINAVDNDTHHLTKNLKKTLDRVGTIRVDFVWVIRKATIQISESTLSISELGTVPEKALKGKTISHQASLGERKPTGSFSTVDVDYPEGNEPFASYSFYYRSKASLKSLLIIPRSPSPVPLEDRDVDSLTLEESRELLRRQQNQMNAANKIKKERIKRERPVENGHVINSDNDDDEISIVSAKRRRLAPTLNEDGVEVVDLT
ncbi:hypothetical protein BDV95DRAFT_381960 [Massariosphaeria phaeospora]|uniref:DUF7918 domain-containing protein n=1 Tax=Massariosphaeria phaeospora TaxID=100035 RepID=A0A7C8IGF4_9PLEO|nr:hypothetical protein BDV95DRAFT_381960 [Massariosphaeria phaeospora]